jgi:RNA polymerase sigma factor (TIGR02999 family)
VEGRAGEAARRHGVEAGSGEPISEPPPDGGFFPLVYDELRRLAAAKLVNEPAGHTLDATALVHEAFLRLGGADFAERSEFLKAAAVAMQRILVDHARRKLAAKRGGDGKRFAIGAGDRLIVSDPDTLLDVDEALILLAAEDPASADVARFRLFAGL